MFFVYNLFKEKTLKVGKYNTLGIENSNLI